MAKIPVYKNYITNGYPLDKCVHILFEQQVKKIPQATAVIYQGRQLTYRQLNERANQLAHYLRKQGLREDNLVGVALERSMELIVALLAIFKAGGAYVPLDHEHPKERISFIIEETKTDIILTQKKHKEKLTANNVNILCIDDEWPNFENLRTTNLKNIAQPQNLAYVMYTSGSTGKPKGVMIEHAALVNHLCWLQETFALTPSDRLLQKTTHTFDISVYELFWPLIAGSTLVFAKPGGHKDPEYLAELIVRENITDINFVPSMLEVFLQYPNASDVKNLKRVACVGEALPSSLRKRFFQSLPNVELHNLYGPTEATINVSWWDCRNESDTPIVPIGSAIANTKLYILDENVKPVPAGVEGELHIGGVQLARGYLNRPQLNNKQFIPNPFDNTSGSRLYKTGDLCRYLPDGNIEFLGRLDHQVKIRGFRIELGEVESVLAERSDIQQVVVMAREDEPGNKRLVAYMTCLKNNKPDNKDLRDYFSKKVPDYMIPSAFVFLDAMPLTPNGKVNRKALPEPTEHLTIAQTDYVPPQNKTQKALADIFAKVLGIEKVGINDNFFELGGHSLLATKVLTRIPAKLKTKVSIASFFENPTVFKLARVIELSLQKNSAETLVSLIPKIKRDGPLTTSYAQRRMWFLYELEPNSPLYNIPFILNMKGNLDIQALERALNDIIQRHDSLRTTFDIQDRQVVQTIHTHSYRQLPVETIPKLSPGESADLTEHHAIKEEAEKLFDLHKGPVLRMKLFRLQQKEHALVLTMHHIVSDGWSIDIFLNELAAAYTARRENRAPDLPPLVIQYPDYAQWQQQWLDGQTRQNQLSYWLEQLKLPLPVLDLPLDFPRPDIVTYKGHRKSLSISSTITQDIYRFNHQNGKTLFMTLLAAFYVLIHRYTDQEEIILGTPIANRMRQEFETLIGFFVNTLAIRANLSQNPSFKEFLEQIQHRCLQAYDNQDLPFEQLVEKLKPKREKNRMPVFQVMFVLQSAHDRQIKLPDLDVECEEISTDTSKVDLTLFIEEFKDQLIATVEYNTDLFKNDTIDRLLTHYQNLLRNIVSNPEARLRELSLVHQSDRKQVIEDTKKSPCEYRQDRCVHELFEDQVNKTPDAIALIYQSEQLTYSQLNKRANQLAHYLRKQGVKPDSLVGVSLDRSPEIIVAFLAILKAGGAYVPLDEGYPKQRIKLMIEDAQLKIILTDDSAISDICSQQVQTICPDADSDAISRESQVNPQSLNDPHHLAYVMFTSGSTGRPKGVEIPHRGIVRLLFGVKYVNLQDRQTFLQMAPVSFDASTFEIWGALLHGHRCVIFPDRIPDLQKLAKTLKIHRVSCLWLTSSLFNFIIDEKPEILKGISQILTGGEALSVEHIRRALVLLPDTQLINGYGPTESTTFTCCYQIAKHLDEGLTSIPIGRPIANTQVYILDKQLKTVPDGLSGELYIGGDGLARGYLNRKELTRERFISNPFDQTAKTRLYKTGDLCRLLKDGNIEFIGRLDDQVKIRGFRIELGEVETTLTTYPQIQQVVVLARQDKPHNKQLVAYYTCSTATDRPTIQDLRTYLAKLLPDYMIPSAFVLMDSMPLTPNGKVNRKALPAPGSKFDREQLEKSPQTPVQKKLANLFAQVLGREKVGISESFFELGGHSLLAVELFHKIQQTFKETLPLATLFRAPTIEQLAELITEKPEELSHKSIVRIKPQGSGEPIFFLPGIGGHSLSFLKLADLLNLDRPVYGLELQGLDGKKMPHKTIEEMASYFIDLIQGIQKNGPYHLAGYSLGGRIAFEIACQLKKKEQDIGMLALVSATAPGYMRTSKHSLVRYLLRLPDFIRLPFKQKLHYFRFKFNDIKKRINRRKKENTFQAKQSREQNTFYMHIKKVERDALDAWINYKPQMKYAGNVLLVRETRIDSPLYRNMIKLQSGWERFITGRIETHEIASGHVEILKDPYVGQLAKCISNYFNKIDKSSHPLEINTKEQELQQRTSKISIAKWTQAPENLTLPEKQCHIFCALLKNHRKFLNDYEKILAKDERDTASRIVNASDREQFIIRRMLLRHILAIYTDTRPADILLDYSATGKPNLSKEHNPSDLRFSISRRNDLAIFAFVCQKDIGIDLEYIHNDKDLLGIAKEQFSTQEYKELSELPDNQRNIRFYSYWTCKEAYIKARGIISLDQFEISIRPDQPPILSSDSVDPEQVMQWTFDLFKVDSQNLGALAIRGQCPTRTYWRI